MSCKCDKCKCQSVDSIIIDDFYYCNMCAVSILSEKNYPFFDVIGKDGTVTYFNKNNIKILSVWEENGFCTFEYFNGVDTIMYLTRESVESLLKKLGDIQ